MLSAVKQCKAWVDKVVVKHQFCPFAEREIENNTVRYVLYDGEDAEGLLHCLIDESQYLDSHSETETTLIVIENCCESFDEFLDVTSMSEQLLEDSGYGGVYQLASFHPCYCFEGVEENDAANYTNRSPYPMLHLLREESLEKAVKNYPSPELIPENNIKLAREKGSQYFQDILNKIGK